MPPPDLQKMPSPELVRAFGRARQRFTRATTQGEAATATRASDALEAEILRRMAW